MRSVLLLFIVNSILVIGCRGTKSNKQNENVMNDDTLDFAIGKPLIIYKTKADYKNKVGIQVNIGDSLRIVSYPLQDDIFRSGEFAYPTELSSGYLIDQQGINQNVAFLSLTQSEYASLDTTIDIDFLEQAILDSDPLHEMYHCGSYAQYVKDSSIINRLMKTNFKGCIDMLNSDN